MHPQTLSGAMDAFWGQGGQPLKLKASTYSQEASTDAFWGHGRLRGHFMDAFWGRGVSPKNQFFLDISGRKRARNMVLSQFFLKF